jgi:hypothetical protein
VTVVVNVTGVDGPGDQLRGNATDNTIYGTPQGDVFMVNQAGTETLYGLGGDDGFFFGSFLDATDSVNGSLGANDQIGLQGNYAGVTLDGGKIVEVEALVLLAGNDTRFGDTANNFYDYVLSLTGAWGALTTFNANSLRPGEDFTVNASATSAGAFAFFGGFGTETLTGGGQSDGFYFGEGRFGASDKVTGGGGADDQLALRGDYSITFGATQVAGIETIALISANDPRYQSPAGDGEFDYSLTLHDAMAGTGETLTITGNGLGALESMTVNGATEASAKLRMIGGAGADSFTGGAGDDEFFGGLGADQMVGNLGADKFIYTDVAQSVVGSRDTIGLFNSSDKIDLSAIDANSLVDGNQDFRWIGSSAFSGGGTGAGELRYTNLGSNNYAIQADVDGNGTVDFEILLSNAVGYTPTDSSFIGLEAAAPAAVMAAMPATAELEPVRQLYSREVYGSEGDSGQIALATFGDMSGHGALAATGANLGFGSDWNEADVGHAYISGFIEARMDMLIA